MKELPVGVTIPKTAKLIGIEDRYGPLRDKVSCGLCGTMHGKGYVTTFEAEGVQKRGLLGHICGRKNFGIEYINAERLFDVAQRDDDTSAALERFKARSAIISPQLIEVLPHLRWQQSVRDALQASSWQVMREAANAARQHGQINLGSQTLTTIAGQAFWIDYRALRRAFELQRDIDGFREYLLTGAQKKTLVRRISLVTDIEHRWSIVSSGSADADQALRPSNLDKLFRSVNTIRLLSPEPWDLSSRADLDEWKLQVRIRGTILERVPRLDESKGHGWIAETNLATGSHA